MLDVIFVSLWQEDEKVIHLVSEYGPKKWTLIARHLKGRTGKQCRERYGYQYPQMAQPPRPQHKQAVLDRPIRKTDV